MSEDDYSLETESYFIDQIQRWEGKRCSPITIKRLPGDASDRLYFRISYSLPSGRIKTFILMKLPFPDLSEELPFVNILNYLKAKNVPVPKLYHYDASKGLLFLEDLSDTTLALWLQGRSYAEKEAMYVKAIDLLMALQSHGDSGVETKCIAFRRAFDADRFLWELNFFAENMLFRLLKLDIRKKEFSLIQEYFLYISETLARQPKCLTHRDYHSRNLMVHKTGELVLLDFQDARLGLCQYDLASLLMDSYVSLEDDLIQKLLEYYIHSKIRCETLLFNEKDFLRLFYLTAIQRNLKAVGTFAYKMVQHKNDQYLKFIPRTLQYVWRNLTRFPELEPLGNTLSFYLGNWPGGKEVDNVFQSY